MDRRDYLLTTASVYTLLAGCVSDNTDNADNEKDSEQTDSKNTGSEENQNQDDQIIGIPLGEFKTIGEDSIWEYKLADSLVGCTLAEDLFVATESSIVRLSAEGDEKWSNNTGSKLNNVCFGKDLILYTAFGGSVVAHDTTSGNEKWQTNVGSGPLKFLGTRDEMAFLAKTSDDPGTFPLLSISVSNGEDSWQSESGLVMRSAISHDLCLIYSVVDGLSAFDTSTGEKRWNKPVSEDYGAKMRVVNDLICLSIDENIFGYSLPDGDKIWEASLPTASRIVKTNTTKPTNRIYVYDNQNTILAFNTQNGNKLWRVNVSELVGPGRKGIDVSSDQLIYHSGTVLSSFSTNTGERQWAYSLGSGYKAGPPVILDDSITIITRSNNASPIVKAFDLTSGTRKWQAEIASLDHIPDNVGKSDDNFIFVNDSSVYGVKVD